eukprot:CCRYP_007407-RA/>CCRYP_007407-RA protein AED:0.73 eAED:0.73 QI:0/-1/0/1/-1/1/1/0/227
MVLPMPNRIITKVRKWRKKSEQHRSRAKLDFLNRHKEQFDWDITDDECKGLVKEVWESSETDALSAELPGIALESDFTHMHALVPPGTTEDDIVTEAMANANLSPSEQLLEITGVTDTHDGSAHDLYIISGDEEEDNDIIYDPNNNNDNADVIFMGHNPYGVLVEPDVEQVDEHGELDREDIQPDFTTRQKRLIRHMKIQVKRMDRMRMQQLEFAAQKEEEKGKLHK